MNRPFLRIVQPQNEVAADPDTVASETWDRKLNIGCGNTFHPAWTNFDLNSSHPAVQQVDICAGLPVPDNSQDVVYHSHVLEHLERKQGEALLRECYRVLRPGGVLRIVVPDLEQIARLYIELHDRAWMGNRQAAERYEWIKLELLDQLVRSTSGGEMGRFMAGLDRDSVAEFVQSRIGVEFALCRSPDSESAGDCCPAGQSASGQSAASPVRTSLWHRVCWSWSGWRLRLARGLNRMLLGSGFVQRMDEAGFRASGEVHRWMYDRFSLRQACEAAGMAEFRICGASESEVPGFADYGLDLRDGRIRKPDSLFAECRKPVVAAMRLQSAA